MKAKRKQAKPSSNPYETPCCGVAELNLQLDEVALAANSMPQALAVTRNGRAVYVVNSNNNTVSVVDVASVAVLTTLATGANPMGIAMSPTADRCYVANFGDDTVSVFDTATDTALPPPIPVQSGTTQVSPASLAVSDDGTRLFVNSDTWGAPGGLAWIDLSGPTTHIIDPPGSLISIIAGVPFRRNPFGTSTSALGPEKFFAAHRELLRDRAIRLADSNSNTFVSFAIDLLPCTLLQLDDTLIVTGYKANGPDAEDLGIDIFRQSDMVRVKHVDVPGVAAQLLPGDPIPIEGFGFSLRAAALDPTCGDLWYGNPSDQLAIGHVGIVNLGTGQFRTFAFEDCNGIAFTPDGRYAFLSDTRNDRVVRVTVH